jgi:hypothetical protein
MNQKHKQAFQELRQWCEKWDAKEISAFVTMGEDLDLYEIADFDKQASWVKYYRRDIIGGKLINFMEQEDDNTKE